MSGWQQGIQIAAKSDVGMRRANNQDSYAVVLAGDEMHWCTRGHVFMVADGMGAHAAGELASKIATDNIPHTYHKQHDQSPPHAIVKTIGEANAMIHGRGKGSVDFEGMGTTCDVLLLLPQGALVAHVGDSRVYRFREGRLQQLTFDHSLQWETKAQGMDIDVPKNVITRSLGPNANVKVDLEGPFPVDIGDAFLLCSDGLTGPVTDEELGVILASVSPQEAVDTLVDLANLRGGPDNITIVVVKVTGPLVTEAGASALSYAASNSSDDGSPLLWAITVGCFLLAALLGLFRRYILAGLAFAGGLIAAGMAILKRFEKRPPKTPGGYIGGPFGRGPHRSYDCTPREELVEKLEAELDGLRSSAQRENLHIDFQRFDALRTSGDGAASRGEFKQAVAQYCQAIRLAMSGFRERRDDEQADR